jgi:hypothetical protein
MRTMYRKFGFILTILVVALLFTGYHGERRAIGATSVRSALRAPTACTGAFTSISKPLNDLGNQEYVRLNTGPTGYTGGLYPGGSNTRPAAHEAAGLLLAGQITPRNVAGTPDPTGRIVMLSIGMSNTYTEFQDFIGVARADPDFNRGVALVNGAQPGMVASYWADPNATTWTTVDSRLTSGGLSPLQVQVAWVKETNYHLDTFPQSIQNLQNDLKSIVRNLKTRYPNIKLVYLSSRTRSYAYWTGLNPEPGAFETGFAVKWLVEAQINGAADLNYDPAKGAVVAPYLSWGPYLWIDGTNPRSDGMVWLPEDLANDCVHPSPSGTDKVSAQLLTFFKNDTTTRPWFSGTLQVISYSYYLPLMIAGR